MSAGKLIDQALASGMLVEDILEAVTRRLPATGALAPPKPPEAPARLSREPPPVVPPNGLASVVDKALVSGMLAEDILAAVTQRLSTAGLPAALPAGPWCCRVGPAVQSMRPGRSGHGTIQQRQRRQ